MDDLHSDPPELIADLTDSDLDQFTIDWRYTMGDRDVTAELVAMFAAEERLPESTLVQEQARRRALKAMADAAEATLATGRMSGLTSFSLTLSRHLQLSPQIFP